MFDGLFFFKEDLRWQELHKNIKRKTKAKKDPEKPCQALISILTSLEKTRKKRKLDLTFSKRFCLPKSSVEKVGESSCFDSSFHFSSSKMCSFSWCDATSSSLNGNPP
jgi:hypothetical protein